MSDSENKPLGPDRFNELPDWEGDLFEWGVWNSSDKTSEREGLPSHYKMRHDAHYVDELLSEKRARQVILIATKDITATVDEGWNVEPLADSLTEFGILQPLLVRRTRGRQTVAEGQHGGESGPGRERSHPHRSSAGDPIGLGCDTH